MTFKVPEKYRLLSGPMGSNSSFGNNGVFLIPYKKKLRFNVQASDGEGWEHVSVTIQGAGRAPTWNEMCLIKSLFWGDDDCVVQYHPAKADYVNCHPHCLHLWRPIDLPLPTPNPLMVGPT